MQVCWGRIRVARVHPEVVPRNRAVVQKRSLAVPKRSRAGVWALERAKTLDKLFKSKSFRRGYKSSCSDLLSGFRRRLSLMAEDLGVFF